jgi:hypothetical protein
MKPCVVQVLNSVKFYEGLARLHGALCGPKTGLNTAQYLVQVLDSVKLYEDLARLYVVLELDLVQLYEALARLYRGL